MGFRTLPFADGTSATSGTSGTFEALNWLRVRYMVLLCLWIVERLWGIGFCLLPFTSHIAICEVRSRLFILFFTLIGFVRMSESGQVFAAVFFLHRRILHSFP